MKNAAKYFQFIYKYHSVPTWEFLFTSMDYHDSDVDK